MSYTRPPECRYCLVVPKLPGVFTLAAEGSSGTKYLDGLASGELLWDHKPVISVVESWRNGESWYRKYSDGWIEQGGLELNIPNNGVRTVTLFKPYSSSTYMALGVLQWTPGIYVNHAACAERTSTAVNLVNYRSAGSATWTINAYWYTCGYGN